MMEVEQDALVSHLRSPVLREYTGQRGNGTQTRAASKVSRIINKTKLTIKRTQLPEFTHTTSWILLQFLRHTPFKHTINIRYLHSPGPLS